MLTLYKLIVLFYSRIYIFISIIYIFKYFLINFYIFFKIYVIFFYKTFFIFVFKFPLSKKWSYVFFLLFYIGLNIVLRSKHTDGFNMLNFTFLHRFIVCFTLKKINAFGMFFICSFCIFCIFTLTFYIYTLKTN